MNFTIFKRLGSSALLAVALFGAYILSCGAATAEPSQDDQFLTMLEEAQIPAVASVPMVIVGAHQVCDQLADGMPMSEVVNVIRVNAFDTDPDARLYAPDRITRTITRFVNAAVKTYCPGEAGKLASTAAHFLPATVKAKHTIADERGRLGVNTNKVLLTPSPLRAVGRLGPSPSPRLVAAQVNSNVNDRRGMTGHQLPLGQINSPNPPQIPAPPPAAHIAEQPPAEAQQPRSPQRVAPSPRQVQPPPQQAPVTPPEELEPPGAAPQPGDAPDSAGGGINGGGDGGGATDNGGGKAAPAAPAPARPAPQPPMSPGVVRLAP